VSGAKVIRLLDERIYYIIAAKKQHYTLLFLLHILFIHKQKYMQKCWRVRQ